MTDNLDNIPRHLAIIMDGNGRWAQRQGLARVEGHAQGASIVKDIVKACADTGVEYLTLWALSSENWKRPKDEISALMYLIDYYLKKEIAELHENNIRLRVIGDLKRLPKNVQETLAYAHELTCNNTKFNLIIAISYGGRQDVRFAIQDIVRDALEKKISLDQIDDDLISNYLSTKNIPNPDLIIRTGDVQRLSNFMPWESTYSELYFSSKMWPDFNINDLNMALADYNSRERRFGGLKDSA